MIKLTLSHDFYGLEKSLLTLAADLKSQAIKNALTRTAAGVRRDIMEELPRVFDRPTPFTVNSIRYKPADDSLAAWVYISEDAPKGVSPRNYLAPEMQGGPRRDKRSENVLKRGGLMEAGQQWVPGRGMTLDAFGNVPGPKMVQILSRLSAFPEQGYRANVNAATKKRLAKLKLATKRTGTDFFIARDKRSGEPLGVWQLLGPGRVQPVLVFANRRPTYKVKFQFESSVHRFAARRMEQELRRALSELTL